MEFSKAAVLFPQQTRLAMQQQTQVQARPETFPDGSLYQLKNLPDGQMEVQLVTGERFVGDPITVTQKLAESKVHTTVWARQKVREAQQTQPMQVDQQPQQIDHSGTYAAKHDCRLLGGRNRRTALARAIRVLGDGNEMLAMGRERESENGEPSRSMKMIVWL